MESVFSWAYVKNIGILSSSVPQSCFGVSYGFSFGASGWHTEAPTLCNSVHHVFFPLGLYLGLVMVVVKRDFIPPGHLPDYGGNAGERGLANQEDTSRCIFSCHSGSRASNAEEMEKIALPLRVGEPRNLFPRLGVG